MNKVIKVDPEEFIQLNDANYYQIYYVTGGDLMAWTGRGFHNPFASAKNAVNIELFTRKDVVEQYYAALSSARDQKDLMGRPINGRLDLVPINIQPYNEED